jgi:hypothetical protein
MVLFLILLVKLKEWDFQAGHSEQVVLAIRRVAVTLSWVVVLQDGDLIVVDGCLLRLACSRRPG